MLRCAGCGEAVSEWAARCPTCGHSTTDAVEHDSGRTPIELATGGARLRRRRRRVTAVVVLIVGAGVAAAGVHLSGTGGELVATGRVLSFTSSGSVVSSTTDGSDIRPVPMIAGTGVFIAADGRFLATGTGTELRFDGRGLVATGRDVPLVGPPGSWRAVAFADHDGALVATESADDQTLVEVATFSGRSVVFGGADSVAGDPAAPGVFAVVPPVRSPSGGAPADAPGSVDARVERDDAGSPPVTLTTASRLVGLLHLRAGTPVVVSVLPDPDGDKVAVTVVPSVAGPQGGIVVLDRDGRTLGTVPLPPTTSQPVWSSAGDALVYSAPTPRRAAIAVWDIGRPPTIRLAPKDIPAHTAFDDCLAATGATSFLCSDTAGGDGSATWLIGRAGSAPLVEARGPALPFALLPDAGR